MCYVSKQNHCASVVYLLRLITYYDVTLLCSCKGLFTSRATKWRIRSNYWNDGNILTILFLAGQYFTNIAWLWTRHTRIFAPRWQKSAGVLCRPLSTGKPWSVTSPDVKGRKWHNTPSGFSCTERQYSGIVVREGI